MKARTNCADCRKRIYKEAETAFLKHEYGFFKDCAHSLAVFATVASLAVMHRRGHYDKMCSHFGGIKHVLKDAIKDRYGHYHDDVIYEIIRNEVGK